MLTAWERWALGLTVAAVTAVLALTPAIARAQEAQSSASIPPTVSFVEPGALTVELSELRKQGGLSVQLHNDGVGPQSISLRVVTPAGAKQEAASKLLNLEPLTAQAGAGEIVIVRIPLGSDPTTDPAAAVSATLVASGQSGGLARRDLSIEVPKTTTDRSAALSPADVGDITLGAINFVPSLLSQLAFLAVALALVSLLATVIYWRRFRRLRYVGVACVVIVGGLGVVGLVGGELPGPNQVHVISSRSIPVTADSKQGTVGVATNSTGELARLRVEANELRVQDLVEAGSFSGNFDLSDEKDTGEAKATVNVRDFWIWAFIGLGIGVLIGWRVRRWFQDRPARLLEVRAERLLAELTAANAVFEEKAKGRPYAGYQARQSFTARMQAISTLLDEGDQETAKTKFKELEDFVHGFLKLRSELADLDVAVERLRAQRKERAFGVREDQVWVLDEARELLAKPFDSADVFEQDADLKERREQAKALTELAAAICELHASAVAHYRAAERAMDDASASRRKQLERVQALADEVGQGALTAEKTETLAELKGKDEEAAALLVRRPRAAGRTKLSELIADAYEARGIDPKVVLVESEFDRLIEEEPVKAELSRAVLSPTGWLEDGEVHVGDEVRLTATFDRQSDLGFAQVVFDLGDGRRMKQQVPTSGSRSVELTTSFSEKGSREIRLLRPGPGGGDRLLASMDVKVEPGTRASAAEGLLDRETREMSLVAMTLAIGSGLLALYVTDASWGEPQDYLAAVLWGAVTSEGITLAAAIADKAWPGK